MKSALVGTAAMALRVAMVAPVLSAEKQWDESDSGGQRRAKNFMDLLIRLSAWNLGI